MIQAFVCLGSNMGDAKAHLARAREEIASLPGVRLAAASSLYSTEPQGRKDQPWFFNQVLRLECGEGVSAVQLLDALLEKETDAASGKALRQEANRAVADMVKKEMADTLGKVLYELSGQMKNAYSRSDA